MVTYPAKLIAFNMLSTVILFLTRHSHHFWLLFYTNFKYLYHIIINSDATDIQYADNQKIVQFIHQPFIRKKNAPVSLATARAISVFPVPGGPYSKMPRGGLTPMALNRLGCRRGSSTISLIWASCFRHPPISSYPTAFRASSSSYGKL